MGDTSVCGFDRLEPRPDVCGHVLESIEFSPERVQPLPGFGYEHLYILAHQITITLNRVRPLRSGSEHSRQ